MTLQLVRQFGGPILDLYVTSHWYINKTDQLETLFNFWKEDSTLGCVSSNMSHFSNISKFAKILNHKSFGNPWDNSCTKFVKLNIKYRFTCGNWDLRKIIKKCQNIMTRFVWKFSFTLYISIDDSTFH